MARKRYKPQEIVAKLRQVDVLVSQGQNIVDAIRQIVVSEVTYYRWRQELGGLKTEQVKCLKVLKLENSRLRKAVSDPTLDKLILQEAARKLLSPAHRRACIEQVRAQLHVSERRALVRRSGSTARRNARSRAVVTTSSVSPPILSSLPGNTAAPAGCLGFWRARSVTARADAVERTARLKIQGPSGKGWSASISSASAATLSVLGAT